MKSKFKFSAGSPIIVSTVILGLLGLIFIYSASCYSAEKEFGDAFYYVKKQAVAFAAGLAAMFVCARMDTELLKKAKWIIYGVSVLLLAMIFIPGLGVESYGAKRWLNLGITTIQPSEISKFGLMIFLAGYMDEYPPTNFKSMIFPLLCGLGLCGLVMPEPNMSITVCVGLALILAMYAAGLQRKWFAVLAAVVIVAVPILIISEPYRIRRFFAFLDPWKNPKDEGYQLIQSYYALGAGGLFGVGLFASRQKYLFLPFAESDFIFSVIGEETGLAGCIAVIVIFLILIIAGIRTAMNAGSRYHALLATNLTAIIAIQTIINMAVVTGLIPPTGVPLPYISAGGSSLVAFMAVSGILCNVSRVTNKTVLP